MNNAHFVKDTDNWRVLDRARRKVYDLEKILLDFQESAGEHWVSAVGNPSLDQALGDRASAVKLITAADGYKLQLDVAKKKYQNCMDDFMVHEVRLPYGNFIWELNT